jgi:hypothetical protein
MGYRDMLRKQEEDALKKHAYTELTLRKRLKDLRKSQEKLLKQM